MRWSCVAPTASTTASWWRVQAPRTKMRPVGSRRPRRDRKPHAPLGAFVLAELASLFFRFFLVFFAPGSCASLGAGVAVSAGAGGGGGVAGGTSGTAAGDGVSAPGE